MSVRVKEVKRWVYPLLAVSLLQLSGLRALCLPSPGCVHPSCCCPACEKHTPPNRSSLPDCCLVSFLNYQGSITEVQTPHHGSELTAVLGWVSMPSTVAPDISDVESRQGAMPTVSPPFSPLLQTCLLLI
jgi:hypothetical protein